MSLKTAAIDACLCGKNESTVFKQNCPVRFGASIQAENSNLDAKFMKDRSTDAVNLLRAMGPDVTAAHVKEDHILSLEL